ncbi:hypothetical protein MRX96_049129 [Rhipicephalus microplus]
MLASEEEVMFSPGAVAKAGSVFADLFAPAPAVVLAWGGSAPPAQSTDWPGQQTRESMRGEGPLHELKGKRGHEADSLD